MTAELKVKALAAINKWLENFADMEIKKEAGKKLALELFELGVSPAEAFELFSIIEAEIYYYDELEAEGGEDAETN